MSLGLLDWRRRVLRLYADVRAEPDPLAAHALWRRGRDRLLATHPVSPLLPEDRAGFQGVRMAPYDPALRFEADPDPDVAPQRLEVPTATDGLVPFERIAVLRLPGLGELDVWWLDSYGGGVFVPVKDALAGTETYGGGRYLLDTVKGADLGHEGDSIVLDFNYSYHPSCVHSSRWSCPLAPPSNILDFAVEAGERLLPG
jgi:uncharacterized protein (DUF1684 family)